MTRLQKWYLTIKQERQLSQTVRVICTPMQSIFGGISSRRIKLIKIFKALVNIDMIAYAHCPQDCLLVVRCNKCR